MSYSSVHWFLPLAWFCFWPNCFAMQLFIPDTANWLKLYWALSVCCVDDMLLVISLWIEKDLRHHTSPAALLLIPVLGCVLESYHVIVSVYSVMQIPLSVFNHSWYILRWCFLMDEYNVKLVVEVNVPHYHKQTCWCLKSGFNALLWNMMIFLACAGSSSFWHCLTLLFSEYKSKKFMIWSNLCKDNKTIMIKITTESDSHWRCG